MTSDKRHLTCDFLLYNTPYMPNKDTTFSIIVWLTILYEAAINTQLLDSV